MIVPLGVKTFDGTVNGAAIPNPAGYFPGTPLAVQQKLMRHADIRTMMNIYGDVGDSGSGYCLC